MSKTALVVDDSPVARHVLAKLLAQNGISADSAESAETALEYLKIQRPDVIFMDHMMPGMDGFQALEAIKANPATATIPVMMYTSQEGELYVGQARALGAFGVLPKDLKPTQLNRVLKALHLIPGDRAEDRAPRPSASQAEMADARRIADLLEQLFREQRTVLREEIREGYQRALASTQTQIPAPPPPPPQPVEPGQGSRPAMIAVVVLGAVALLLGYLYLNSARLLDETTQRSSALIASAAQLTDASAQALSAQPVVAADTARIVELIEWTLNESNTYGFDEIALSEPRADKLRRVIELAAGFGIAGRLALRVHVGRFCMTFNEAGAAQLAPADLPVTQCEQLGWLPNEAFSLGRRQTLGFANIVMDAQRDTQLRVETSSAGSDEPVVPYPNITETLSAGEWNRIAAANHRIDVRFSPAPQPTTAAR